MYCISTPMLLFYWLLLLALGQYLLNFLEELGVLTFMCVFNNIMNYINTLRNGRFLLCKLIYRP